LLTLSRSDTLAALQEIYKDPRVMVPHRAFSADRRSEEDVAI
jgi:hypothetical protein